MIHTQFDITDFCGSKKQLLSRYFKNVSESEWHRFMKFKDSNGQSIMRAKCGKELDMKSTAIAHTDSLDIIKHLNPIKCRNCKEWETKNGR